MNRKYITFGAPLIGKEEMNEVLDSMKTGWLGTGPKTKKFEYDFKLYKSSKYAVALNSCTAALHLSLISLNLKKDDEVITSALTFCSTVNSIIHSGAKPVIADVDPITMNIDPDDIEKKITKKTKCLIIVHFAGRPCNMKRILKICYKYKIQLIEDCAHAIEGSYNNKPLGTFGSFGCFSFYATKNLVTGEGGMILSKKKELNNKIQKLALHGLSKDAWSRFSDKGYKHYYVQEAGFKYNMMDIQASIGIHQLKKIKKFRKRRSEIWNYYNQEFSNLNITIPAPIEKNTVHSYHLYTILIDNNKNKLTRDEFMKVLHQKNIGTGIHYLSIPEHPYYKLNYKWKCKDYPNAYRIGRQTISIPLSPGLSNNQIEYIARTIKNLL